MMSDSIRARLARLGVVPGDVTERFDRSGGPGGQHVNKVSTAVTLTCPKRGLTISVSDTRSQARNRETAWIRLAETLERRDRQDRADRQAARERKRRAARKRPRAVKERMLETKRRRSRVKQLRSRPVE